MATYAELAAQAYQWRLAQDAAEAEQARADLILAAQNAAVPLFTDPVDGALVLDPTKKALPALVDMKARLVVLTVDDASVPSVSFAVKPETTPPTMHLASMVDGVWVRGVQVADLDDVGRALAGNA